MRGHGPVPRAGDAGNEPARASTRPEVRRSRSSPRRVVERTRRGAAEVDNGSRSATQLTIDAAVEQVAESPFYIPMTGPAARPRRTLKHDDTFIVLDSHGDIGASAGGPDGLFHADTRFLSRLELC